MAWRQESRGSASIEATISLVFFIYVVIGIYTLANYCIVQEKVAYATNATAKQMSQYAYVYHVVGLDKLKSGLDDKASQAVETLLDINAVVDDSRSLGAHVAEDPSSFLTNTLLQGGSDDLESLNASLNRAYGTVYENMSNDPAEYIKSFFAYGGSTVWNYASAHAAALLARSMCREHLTPPGGDANTYLSNMGVVGGYDGLNFNQSTMFATGTDKKIEIVVYYRMSLKNIIPNPALNQEVVICQRAVTDGWMGGDAA